VQHLRKINHEEKKCGQKRKDRIFANKIISYPWTTTYFYTDLFLL